MSDEKVKIIKNLKSVSKDDNTIITPNKNSKLFLSYVRSNVNLLDEKDRREFIMGTERVIRSSNDYKAYIAYLKEHIPATKNCALYNNISDDMAKIEMHHGPVFSLAEITTIVLNHFIKNKKPLDSFLIADMILQDHFDNLIQVIFLCKSAHDIISAKKIGKDAFVSMDHAIGDIVSFITKYSDSITYYEINKLRNYLYMSNLYDKGEGKSIYDFLKERVKSFKNN
ncbi:MAG: hypothetical protein ACRC5M_06630 [Anaeroplasmataceae bacterium]